MSEQEARSAVRATGKRKTSPKPEDAAIGARVRARRIEQGMSQEKLGEALGITFQQIQKYEKGTNRIGGSRMIAIARALGCSAADLFGETDGDPLAAAAGFSSLDFRIARASAGLTDGQRRAVLAVIEAFERGGIDAVEAAHETGREARPH